MSPRSGWLLVNEIVPRLRSAVPLVAHCIGAEDPEELIGDATLHATRILHSAESRGKTITAGNAAFYAVQHTKSGRRSTGNSCADVMAAGTQLHGHTARASKQLGAGRSISGLGSGVAFSLWAGWPVRRLLHAGPGPRSCRVRQGPAYHNCARDRDAWAFGGRPVSLSRL